MNSRLAMKIVLPLCISLSFFLLNNPLAAQIGPGESPPVVKIASPGPDASWLVRFTPKSPGQESAELSNNQRPYIKEIRVTRIKDRRLDLTTWSDGLVFETWHLTHGREETRIVMSEDRRFKAGQIRLLAFPPDHEDTVSVNFPELDWVASPGVEVESTDHRGKPAVRFRFAPTDEEGLSGRVFEAWVDLETRLPLSFDDGRVLRTYTFSPSPQVLPPVPQRFLDRLAQRDKLVAKDQQREMQLPR